MKKILMGQILSSLGTASRSTDMPSDRDPGLLRIPPELRNIIYHDVFALDEDEMIDITLEEVKCRTSLLRVCSQIRSEAKSVFYATNSFYVADFFAQQAELGRFLKNAGSSAKHVPELIIKIELPQIFLDALLLVDQIHDDMGEELRDLICDCYHHVRKVLMWDSFNFCEHLIDFGVSTSILSFEEYPTVFDKNEHGLLFRLYGNRTIKTIESLLGEGY